MKETFRFLAVDPGLSKCGLAVMASDGAVLVKSVAPAGNVAEAAAELAAAHGGIDLIVVGGGTGSKMVADKLLASGGLPRRVEFVQEKNTTLDARKLYENEHPLPWPLGMIPRWLFANPRALDAYAAVAIGLRYIAAHK